MKRMILVLVVLFTASVAFAGGKECDMKKASHKKVALTGTIAFTDGDSEKAVFKVANSDKTYDICHKSKASLTKLGDGASVEIKGQLVSCGDGEELMIDEAKKI